uniref:Retinol dehydrogenase 11-like n=2 Tax=Hirondellea gigas TaxID=1518452 RepID=A0A6A7G3X2_9CRUS
MGHLEKMTSKKIMRMLHPSYLSLRLFFRSWGQFLWAELYNLLVLFTAVYLLQRYFMFHKLRLWLYWLSVLVVRKFMAGGFCRSDVRLNGCTVVITGADSGIGKEVAKELALRGAHLVLGSRDLVKAEQTKKELENLKGSVEIRHLDLSSLESVRTFANGLINHKYHIHMLLNIAGEMMCPYKETADGLEEQMAVNHLGHFLLTNMLLPWLTHHKPARIINVAATAHIDGRIPFSDFNYKQQGYSKWKAYCNSKLATVLFTRQLARNLKDTNVEAFCANPGVSQSALYRHVLPEFVYKHIIGFLVQTPREAAQTITYCATEAKQDVNFYYSECSSGWPSDEAMDDDLAQRLWRESEKLVGLEK